MSHVITRQNEEVHRIFDHLSQTVRGSVQLQRKADETLHEMRLTIHINI